jgi:membrane protease YdiL (CAAX protease family)
VENNSASSALLKSPIASEPNAFPWLLTFLAFVGMLVIFAVVLFAGIVWFLLTHGQNLELLRTASTKGVFGVELQGIAELIVIAYLMAVVPALAGTTPSGIGFRPLSARTLAYVGGAVVVMFVAVTALGSLLTTLLHAKTPEEAVAVFLSLHSPAAKAGFAFFAAVVAPVWEEFVFRIFLFSAMFKWWGFRPAAIVSSILFGLAHAQPGGIAVNVGICIPLALGGFVLCWVYATTRNAWANILTHGLFNLISLALLFVAPQLAK